MNTVIVKPKDPTRTHLCRTVAVNNEAKCNTRKSIPRLV